MCSVLFLGTEAAGVSVPPLTGAAAAEYNRDRYAPSVTVARSSSLSLSLEVRGVLCTRVVVYDCRTNTKKLVRVGGGG